MKKANETRGHGKEQTMDKHEMVATQRVAARTKARVTVPDEKTQVMARAHRSHWFESERGGYTTVQSFGYLDTPKEDERMKKDLGAFADEIADIRVAFQSATRSDGTPIRYAIVLANGHQASRVLRLLYAFWLGFNRGKHTK